MKYLTPAIVRAQPQGLPIGKPWDHPPAVSDLDILGWINEAEGMIDAYMGFDERNSLGFAYGTRGEAQVWDPNTRRVSPSSFPTPVQSIQAFTIQYGQNPSDGSAESATIPVNQVIINNDDNYFEVITLAVLLAGIAPVLAFTGVIEPVARLTYTAGYQVVKKGLRLFSARGIPYQSLVPMWDTTQPITVYRNGTPLDESAYTLNAADGSLSIPTAVYSDVITADFTHQIPDVVTRATRRAMLEGPIADYFANTFGMTGISSMKTADQSIARGGTGVGAGTWQAMLDALRPVAIAMA